MDTNGDDRITINFKCEVNVQEYISSGILEAYALGEVTAAERLQIEQALTQYPEIGEELRKVEETLEKVVFATLVYPRSHVKERIMAKISAERFERKVVALTPKISLWKYAAAASVTIALVTSYLAFYYRQQWQETTVALTQIIAQNQQMAQEYNVVNQKLDKIQNDLAIIGNASFTKVVMKGTDKDKNALASIYWNSSTKEVYLSIQQLKEISKENQFQLWAIVNGKPVDAGVFNSNFAGLLRMKNITGATAFAVTIEPRGGKESPSMETMQVLGIVSGKPS